MPSVYIVRGLLPKIVSRTVLWTDVFPNDWLGRPCLLDVDGVWIVVYRQAINHLYDVNSKVHIRFSDDEGENWTAADTYLDSSSVSGAPFGGHGATNSTNDIQLARCPNGDILLHISETTTGHVINGSWQYRSTDGGKSWTGEGRINDDTGLALEYGQAVTVGGRMYISGHVDPESDGQPYYNRLYVSDDNGVTWTKLEDITDLSENTTEACLVHTGGTNFFAILRAIPPTTTYRKDSNDLGATWGTLQDVGSTFGAFHRVRALQYGNRLYLFGRDWDLDGTGRRVALYASGDMGDTWTGPLILSPEKFEDAGYPAVLPRSDGTLYMLCYEGTEEISAIVEYILEP